MKRGILFGALAIAAIGFSAASAKAQVFAPSVYTPYSYYGYGNTVVPAVVAPGVGVVTPTTVTPIGGITYSTYPTYSTGWWGGYRPYGYSNYRYGYGYRPAYYGGYRYGGYRYGGYRGWRR